MPRFSLPKTHAIRGHDLAPRLGDVSPRLVLRQKIAHRDKSLSSAKGPLHLVGHSYGGAIAFKIATDSPLADRVRSLTLIEPVLPTLLRENPADRRLHDLFAQLARNVSADLWNGMYMEAIDRFLSYSLLLHRDGLPPSTFCRSPGALVHSINNGLAFLNSPSRYLQASISCRSTPESDYRSESRQTSHGQTRCVSS